MPSGVNYQRRCICIYAVPLCLVIQEGRKYMKYMIMQALTGNHVGPATAAASLEEIFSGGGGGGRGGTSKRVTVLLVDEMDLLVTKKQTVRVPCSLPLPQPVQRA